MSDGRPSSQGVCPSLSKVHTGQETATQFNTAIFLNKCQGPTTTYWDIGLHTKECINIAFGHIRLTPMESKPVESKPIGTQPIRPNTYYRPKRMTRVS